MLLEGSGKGRRDVQQIIQEVSKVFNIDLVQGVNNIIGYKAKQVENSASFTFVRKSYYIHQNNQDFVEWETNSVSSKTNTKEVVFVFTMGTGFGSALPQPSGQFDIYINGNLILSFCVTKESMIWQRNGITFHYWVKKINVASENYILKMDEYNKEESMASYGIGYLKVPKGLLIGNKRAVLKVVGRSRQISKNWFKLDEDNGLILKCDIEEGLKNVIEGKKFSDIGRYKVFFGDIHTHSGETHVDTCCGLGSIDENYIYARDVSNIDVYSLTDHDWQIRDEEDFRFWLEKSDEYNKNGEFVTIPGYEWTSLKYGHRNVYYADTKNCPFIKSSLKCNVIDESNITPFELWRELKKSCAKAITIPHHPNVGFFPVDWFYINEEFDRLVEIYSSWGNSEYYGAPYSGYACDRVKGLSVQDVLAKGYKLGIIASSDGHDGCPGHAQWSNKQPHIRHHLGSGLIGILANELTREAVFEAMYKRRCYATTGVRIILDFRVNGNIMGSEILVKSKKVPQKIEIRVIGTVQIERVEVLKNNKIIYKEEISEKEIIINFIDRTPLEKNNFYYVRVTQKDLEMAWSSPIWIRRQ